MSAESETIREKYMRDRSADLENRRMEFLLERADQLGVTYTGSTPVQSLCRWIANNEWNAEIRPRLKSYSESPAEESPYAMEAQGEELTNFDQGWTPERELKAKDYIRDQMEKNKEFADAALRAGMFVNMDSGPQVAEPHWHNKILLNVDPREMKTESADAIINTVLPKVLSHFLAKNAEYGDRHRDSKYGPAGELIGIDRKMDKLRECLWEGKELAYEQPEEMLVDVIGSALLALDLLQIRACRASLEE